MDITVITNVTDNEKTNVRQRVFECLLTKYL